MGLRFIVPAATMLTVVGVLALGLPLHWGPGSVVPQPASVGFRAESFDIRGGVDPWALIRDPASTLPDLRDPVPMFSYHGAAWDHPSRQAEAGLRLLAEFDETDETRYLEAAKTVAVHLLSTGVRLQDSVNFEYHFEWNSAVAPWHSGLAQGKALSLFSRLAEETGAGQWREAADDVYRSFLRPPGNGPWYVLVDGSGSLWIEEAPDEARPGLIVNGHIAAAWGLADYWRLTGEPEARHLFEGALTTIKDRWADIRVVGDWSRYGLVDLRQLPRYHSTHVLQLRALAALTGDAEFGDMATELVLDGQAAAARRWLRWLVVLGPIALAIAVWRRITADKRLVSTSGGH